MEPTQEEWRALYASAVAFRDAAPWRWMEDGEVFGVQDPERGAIGYCCVMGNMGEHFALGVYLGSLGLAGYWEMRDGPPPELQDPAELLNTQLAVMASFEDRELLSPRDREQIKALGLRFRGRNQWPQFRSYRPGYQPWYLTAEEARFLTLCLQQALDVAPRLLENPKLFPEAYPRGRYLVRVPEQHGAGWRWKDTLQRPAPVRRPAPPVVAVDAGEIERLRALPATLGVLEMDYFFAGAVVQEEGHDRPFLGQVIVAVEAEGGLVLGNTVSALDEAPTTLARQLLEILAAMGERPSRV